MRWEAVQVWGDSVMKGVIYDEARGRYALLKENAPNLVAREVALPIVNRSQMGRTAPAGLKVLSDDETPLAGSLVLIEYGGNDCDFDWAAVAEAPDRAHQPNTPVAKFVESLAGIVELVRARGGTPILCTLPPLDPHRYFAWITRNGLSKEHILNFLGVPERIYRWQEYYSSLVQRTAAQLCVAVLPVRDRFLEVVRGEDVLCVDGIHPNGLGHRLIADAAISALKDLAKPAAAVFA